MWSDIAAILSQLQSFKMIKKMIYNISVDYFWNASDWSKVVIILKTTFSSAFF